ncbi:SapC family protein [Asticcacaulis sp. ZE23SCel15]|uniref:SapC family protein n=1 Tax=Asticcacaulis sp. ZE23SCel15 TaxID=3059027 RepID=UPI00265F2552|nr:SapC family protein [Asticcacaulis sp. ZE23SCel15]WKL57034.1 SapC family protein [Asticcacaulis sp. ZE23SCel15]
MRQPVLIDNVEHHDLKYISGHAPAFGDSVNQAPVFPTEFADIQREYPIFFRRDDKNNFYAVALLGLDKDENLFLDGTEWNARYIPAMIARGPFLIGFKSEEIDGETRREPMIHADITHPRFSRTEGEPLFLPHGGNAPRLERIARTLRTIHTGAEVMPVMFSAFEAAGLLAPIEVDIRLDETTAYKIPDLFGISAEALSGLKGETLQSLNQSGFLALAFQVMSSLGNMSKIIELKNRKRGAGL